MVDETITEMPTMTLDPYIEEHKHTNRVAEAHPITEEIVHRTADEKLGPPLLHHNLAFVQSMASKMVTGGMNGGVDSVEQIAVYDNVFYYQANSSTFYEIVSHAVSEYNGSVYIEAENLPAVIEAHTRQYLYDHHGYDSDFGGEVPNDEIDKTFEATLCNAQNDEHRLRDEEPENAHYRFTDARGLVVEAGTHE